MLKEAVAIGHLLLSLKASLDLYYCNFDRIHLQLLTNENYSWHGQSNRVTGITE